LSVVKLIEYSVSFDDAFSKSLVIDLGHLAAHLRMLDQWFDRRVEPIDEGSRILWRGPLKVVPNGL
jgi:hypothetical protein